MAVRLVERDGTINAEGFYNYLTAWYHIDNMMYYVSQASFYPSPPHWAFNPDVRPPSTIKEEGQSNTDAKISGGSLGTARIHTALLPDADLSHGLGRYPAHH